jgi:type III secretion protein J
MLRLSLCLLLTGAVSGCEEQILHDLEESQANRVRVLLGREGISAAKVRESGGWSISVASSAAAPALALLEDLRVRTRVAAPQPQSSQSLLQSKEERRQAAERALAWEIEQTLERLPGILEARVHLNRGRDESSLLPREPPVQSASVLLIAQAHAPVEGAQARTLVAGAAGLKQEEVNVLVAQRSSAAAEERIARGNAERGTPSAERARSAWTGLPWLRIGIASVFSVLIAAAAFLGRRGSKAVQRLKPAGQYGSSAEPADGGALQIGSR